MRKVSEINILFYGSKTMFPYLPNKKFNYINSNESIVSIDIFFSHSLVLLLSDECW